MELNTIASSFSSLSSKVSDLHHYLSKRTDFFNDHAPGFLNILPENLPSNDSGKAIALGIATAWKLYDVETSLVMMIVQPGENNIFDQRWIELELFQKHGIKLIRRTLAEVQKSAKLENTKLKM